VRHPEYHRSSSGTCKFFFTPQPDKSFNRGFTTYFLYKRSKDVSSFDTPKSSGEKMGTVKEVQKNCLTVSGIKPFHNGDGICYKDRNEKLQGFRINRTEGSKLYPYEMPKITPRTLLYRNYDQEFERILSQKSAERKIGIAISLTENSFGFSLSYTDEDKNSITLSCPYEKNRARIPQTENITKQLGKLGDTPFVAKHISIHFTENGFIPLSLLTDFRRQVTKKMIATRYMTFRQEINRMKPTFHTFSQTTLTYLGNVYNSQSAAFYHNHGVVDIRPAYEQKPVEKAVLMFCKHCLRYSMDLCPQQQKKIPSHKEPFYLITKNGKRFRLSFDCKNCLMQVIKE
jgi:putative protease